MRIRKYDFDYSRRFFLEKTTKGIAGGITGAGVLTAMWPELVRSGEILKAYPDELTSIEMQTKGKVKVGDYITAANVEHVKHLLDPVCYKQVKDMGRKIKIRESTKDVAGKMYSKGYWDATVRGQKAGGAKFGPDGNVMTADGKQWTGGSPFPDPVSDSVQGALQATMNLTLSWGRADMTQYVIKQKEVDATGKIDFEYDFSWLELAMSCRTDGTIVRNRPDLLRQQVVFFTATDDVAGTSFMSTWYYDQRKMPELYGYLPQFRRVRQFPSNQRFEPLVPGATWFLTDAWAAGDPMLVWGEYETVTRKPMLGAYGGNWKGKLPNWEKGRHGGPKGVTFYDTEFELAPEVLVVRAKPTGFPRAPVGYKDMYIDTRNCMYCSYIRYDRNGKEWLNFETGSGQLSDGDFTLYYDGTKDPIWSWNYVLSYDVQSGRMTQIEHADRGAGGISNRWNVPAEEVHDKYFTQKAIQSFGKV